MFHRPLADVVVVHVGDLELAARGRLERRDDVEDVGIVEVDPGDREFARGGVRLLDDVRDPPSAVEVRDAEVAEMLGVALAREDDPAAPLLPLEVVDDVPTDPA